MMLCDCGLEIGIRGLGIADSGAQLRNLQFSECTAYLWDSMIRQQYIAGVINDSAIRR
jgi:hypothetical protein